MIQELIYDAERAVNKAKAEEYLAARTGTFEYRCGRYKLVADRLFEFGLVLNDLIVDVGAGMCEFDQYLRTRTACAYRYLPVDASIDGTDLNHWRPSCRADFIVSIETLEHLDYPQLMLARLENFARKAVIITTPNPAVVDVFAMDPTHKCPLFRTELIDRGWKAEFVSLFGTPDDTILAWKPTHQEGGAARG